MRAHEVVMAWVTGELSSGRLSIGDRLPGERALAETLGVSRSSLREALRILEALGSVRSSTGSGPKSGTIITASPEQALSLALKLQLATSNVEYQHIAETRLLLETWAAQHSNHEQGEWQQAETLLERMEQPGITIDDFLAWDAEFHVTLARSAANPLISTLMEALRLSIAEHASAGAKALPNWEGTVARLKTEHRAILESFQNGDGDQAAVLLRAHIEGYHRETEHLSR